MNDNRRLLQIFRIAGMILISLVMLTFGIRSVSTGEIDLTVIGLFVGPLGLVGSGLMIWRLVQGKAD